MTCSVMQPFKALGFLPIWQEVMQRGAEQLSKMINKNFDRQSLEPEETLFVTSEDVAADHLAAEEARGSFVKAALSDGVAADLLDVVKDRLLSSTHAGTGHVLRRVAAKNSSGQL